MNESDKVNEEIRNYKLYKIQRAITREQEFKELKNELEQIRKNEILNYSLIILNIILILLFVYNLYKSLQNIEYYNVNTALIYFNISTILILSLYLTYKFYDYNTKLKKYIKISEKTEEYFRNESENLKSVYENFVDNYLEKQKDN